MRHGSRSGGRFRGRVALSTLLTLSAVTACTGIIPGTMPHDIRYDAAALERERCDSSPVDPRIYSASIIQKVEPYYRHVMGGPSGLEARFSGVQLELRPLPGVTIELLERGLMCRSAQAMLGHVEPAANEPYFLPDAWVKIDVSSSHGAFLVTLAAEDPARAHELFERAKAFASPALAKP
jgi:hypothetical protein